MRTAQVAVTGVAASAWLPLDPYTDAFPDGLFVKVGAGCTLTLQGTADDVFDPTVTPVAFNFGAPFSAIAANAAGQLPFACKAVRINQTAGAAQSTLQVVTKGLQ
jgi:hypothetical protein